MTVKLLFGILSIIPAVFAYILYFKNMFAGKTKPHTFSWLIWAILAGNGFFAQVAAHGGIGAWATGLTSLASFAIFCFAMRLGATKPAPFDWVLLALALGSLLLLIFIKSKEAALCLTLCALIAGFVMNTRKAYRRPHEENATAFLLNTLKFVPAIFALASFTFLTAAYPLVAALGNAVVAAVVYARRRQLAIAAA